MLITRTIDSSDLDIITEWWYQEWKDIYVKNGIDTLQKARLDVDVRINNSTLNVFVVREGSLIVACGALNLQRDPAFPRANVWLSNVYTRRENRYEGYGSHLIRAIIRYASERFDTETLYMTTTQKLLHWYKSFGFQMRSLDTYGNIVMFMKDTGSLSPTLCS